MDAKEAIEAAKNYVADLFAAEGAANIGLEELRFDEQHGQWLVTIGFTRPWEGPRGPARWTDMDGRPWPRTFKTVEIDDKSGKIVGVKHWSFAA